MIIDLAQLPQDRTLNASVVIAGAGIAGLLLARALRQRRIPVVVLESGGLQQEGETHALNRVVSAGRPYMGAEQGRVRGLGGTSARWGGALIPFLPADMGERLHTGVPAWPVALEELLPYASEIETLFKVVPGPYDIGLGGGRDGLPPSDGDFITRLAKWPTFARRNLATLLGPELRTDDGLAVYLNATVTQFSCDEESGKLRSVTACAPGGRRMTVIGNYFAVCSGAIESTRLLLLLDSQHGGRIFAGCEALGRNFHDHVSLPAATLDVTDVTALNRLAGFRFSGSTMRSVRLELSPQAQAQERCGSAFGHIAFTTDGTSGFDALRETLRGLQRTGHIDPAQALRVARDVPYLMRTAYWRYIRGQLLWPRPAQYQLHIVAEQLPRAVNRISLTSQIDAFGCPLAQIAWHIDRADLATIQAFARRFDAYWRRHGLTSIAALNWNIPLNDGDIAAPDSSGDIFHPGGTTRMGSCGRSAVVDRNLAAFALPNLFVASTSVFPSGASANPTFTLMLATARLARHLGGLLSPSVGTHT